MRLIVGILILNGKLGQSIIQPVFNSVYFWNYISQLSSFLRLIQCLQMIIDPAVRVLLCFFFFFSEQSVVAHIMSVLSYVSSLMSYLWLSMWFTIQTWCITYLDPVCLWLFPNVDQVNCVFIVHMVPIE